MVSFNQYLIGLDPNELKKMYEAHRFNAWENGSDCEDDEKKAEIISAMLEKNKPPPFQLSVEKVLALKLMQLQAKQGFDIESVTKSLKEMNFTPKKIDVLPALPLLPSSDILVDSADSASNSQSDTLMSNSKSTTSTTSSKSSKSKRRNKPKTEDIQRGKNYKKNKNKKKTKRLNKLRG